MPKSVIISTPVPTLDEFCRAIGISKKRQKQLEKLAGERMSAKHPGFQNAAKKIAAKEGVSKQSAGAILASATRKASPAAKANNPRLKRVKGK